MDAPAPDIPIPTLPPARAPAWSWLPLAAVAVLLPLAIWGPFAGPLLPCLALGLAPAAALRAAGRWSPAALRWGVALALLAWLWRKDAIAPPDLDRLRGHWPWLAAGLLLAPLQPLCGALRWRILLNEAGVPLGFGPAFRLTLIGGFFSLFIPGGTGGDMVRAGVVGLDRGRWGVAAFSVLLDRILGVPPLLLLMAFAWCLEWNFIVSTPAYAWMGVAMWPAFLASTAGSLALPALGGRLERRFGGWRDSESRARRWIGRSAALTGHYGGRWGAIGAAYGYGLCSHAATVAQCWCFGVAAGMAEVSWPRYLLAVPTGLLVNAIPLAPGGLGQGELAFAKLFDAAAPGLGNDAAGMTTMLCLRFGTVLVGLAGGATYLAGRHRLAGVKPPPLRGKKPSV